MSCKVTFLDKVWYSEKATKFWEISNLRLSTVHTDKSRVKISQNFVAFSEYINFKTKDVYLTIKCVLKIFGGPFPYVNRREWGKWFHKWIYVNVNGMLISSRLYVCSNMHTSLAYSNVRIFIRMNLVYGIVCINHLSEYVGFWFLLILDLTFHDVVVHIWYR